MMVILLVQVVNLDLPYDAATYMHRVGRTGRFGTHGVAVTVASSAELIRLHEFIADAAGSQVRCCQPHRVIVLCSLCKSISWDDLAHHLALVSFHVSA